MRLIGESRLARHVDQWALKMNLLPREFQTAHKQIPVRTCPEQEFELAGKIIARQSREGFQLRRMHDTGPLRVEKLSSAFDDRDVDALRGPRLPTAPLSGNQSFRQVKNETIDCQRFQWGLKGILDSLRQCDVRRDGLANEGQRIGLSTQRPEGIGQKRWLHIDDPIAEAVIGARASVVDLIGIQHDHLPGRACLDRSSVVEYLDSAVGDADGIGVVAMLRIRHAGKPRAKQLDAADWTCARYPASD